MYTLNPPTTNICGCKRSMSDPSPMVFSNHGFTARNCGADWMKCLERLPLGETFANNANSMPVRVQKDCLMNSTKRVFNTLYCTSILFLSRSTRHNYYCGEISLVHHSHKVKCMLCTKSQQSNKFKRATAESSWDEIVKRKWAPYPER